MQVMEVTTVTYEITQTEYSIIQRHNIAIYTLMIISRLDRTTPAAAYGNEISSGPGS